MNSVRPDQSVQACAYWSWLNDYYEVQSLVIIQYMSWDICSELQTGLNQGNECRKLELKVLGHESGKTAHNLSKADRSKQKEPLLIKKSNSLLNVFLPINVLQYSN
jgi:hypothetical protein